MTIKLEIKSFSLIKLHTNTRRHIKPFCDNTVFYQWHSKFTMWYDKIKYNIRLIKPYKSDSKVEDSNSINMYDAVNI